MLPSGVANMIIEGPIFIYLRSAQLISFKIDYFLGLGTQIYEYGPP